MDIAVNIAVKIAVDIAVIIDVATDGSIVEKTHFILLPSLI